MTFAPARLERRQLPLSLYTGGMRASKLVDVPTRVEFEMSDLQVAMGPCERRRGGAATATRERLPRGRV